RHAENQIDRLPEPVGERDLGGRAAAARGGVVPEGNHVVGLGLDAVQIPGDDLADDRVKSGRGPELPLSEVLTLLVGQALLLVRGRIVDSMAEVLGEKGGELAAPVSSS